MKQAEEKKQRLEKRNKERERQEKEGATKAGILNVLPPDLRLEIFKFIAGETSAEALENTKRYYLAHPPSQKSSETTKAILGYLRKKFNFGICDSEDLKYMVTQLQKLPTMAVFKNPEMQVWVQKHIEQLKGEEELRKAIENKNPSWIYALLDKGVNVNAEYKDRNGKTPLLYALSSFYFNHSNPKRIVIDQLFETVAILIEEGANVNAQTESGYTVLHEAVYRPLTSIVGMLLRAGADPNLGRSKPLSEAILRLTLAPQDQKQEYKKIITMLLEAGADPNDPNSNFTEYVSSFRTSNEEEKAEIIGLFRKHGFKE